MSKGVCKCGSDSFASSNEGSVVCTQCGDVKESANIVSEVQFGGDSSIVGTFVSATRKPSSSYRSLGGRDSRAMSLENARRRLDEIASSLRIRNHLVDSAQRSFELAMENNFTKGRKTKLVAASCLYVVCRREKTPHLLIDFSEILEVNVFILANTFLQLIKLLNIQLPIVDPSFFIQRFASSLEFGDQTKDIIITANKLVARMKRDWMCIGRKPSGICGASLYIASKIHGFKRSMKEIVHVVKIGESTLLTRLDEFRKTPSASLKFDEFSGMDMEDECDPPAFTRNRRKELEQEEKHKLLEEKRLRKEKRKERREIKRLKKEVKLKRLNSSNNKEIEKILESPNNDKETTKETEGNEESEDEESEEEEEEQEEGDLDENGETTGKKRKSKKEKKRNIKKLKSDKAEGEVEDEEDDEEEPLPTQLPKPNRTNSEEDIEKESNELIKNFKNISDINVDKISSTLLENIERFEQIQNNIQVEAQKVKDSMNNEQNKNNNTEPNTTQSTTTTTTTSTQNESNTPLNDNTPIPIDKTMASQVQYPVLPKSIDPSTFLPNDNLDGLSDDELDIYLEHDKETVKMKEQIWVELNKEWIEKNEERQREIEEDIKAGRPPRKRKVVSKKSAENAAAAAEEELKKRTRNAKLVEKLGLFKPNFVSGLFGGAQNQASAVGNLLAPGGGRQATTKGNAQKETQKETNEDDDDDDFETANQQTQAASLFASQMNDNYGTNDYDEDY